MELGDRVKILVFLNLLYYILNFQGITVISLLSYFLFVALVLLTASNTFRKRRVSATPSEYVSRETVEKLFKATYGTVNYLHSRIASVADLKQLEKLLFVSSYDSSPGGGMPRRSYIPQLYFLRSLSDVARGQRSSHLARSAATLR